MAKRTGWNGEEPEPEDVVVRWLDQDSEPAGEPAGENVIAMPGSPEERRRLLERRRGE